MNKKFITLCVSALLAGGMVAPAFATTYTGGTYFGSTATSIANFGESYYLMKFVLGASTGSYTDLGLKVTKNTVTTSRDEISSFTLWKIVPVKSNGQLTSQFELVNAANIKLGVNDANELVPNGKYTNFEFVGSTLRLVNKNLYLTYNQTADKVEMSATQNTLRVNFYIPAVEVMNSNSLNEKFLNGFTLGVGYYDENNNFVDYAESHNLKGNPFQGELKATRNIGSISAPSGISFETLANDETYLLNGGKVIVLFNEQWSGLNNSLKTDGYKFTTMTPAELADQLVWDKANPTKAVVRSYVFKVTAPNAISDRPLEVALRIGSASNAKWEELYVSEVDGNYYLTTAIADESTTPGKQLQKADYADDQVYAYFVTSNYVNPEDFFSYAWNIVRVSDNKTMNPMSTEWQDVATVAMTAPEGQWILKENSIKDGYEWINRETKEEASILFASLRYTDEANVYRVGEGINAQYYQITKAKNAAGVEINLDAYDEFDYYGADVKSNTTGVDNTYKIQFTSDLTGDPIYIGMDGVGALMLTKDPAAAVNFEPDTVKTTDKVVVVNPEDKNVYNDVFRILNTYIGKDEKGNWIDKVDTVSFYRYNFMHDGKYLHFNEDDNKFELVAPTYNTAGEFTNSSMFDAFVIKEKDNNQVNILNVDNDDFDDYLENVSGKYNTIVTKDSKTGNVVSVDGEKILASAKAAGKVAATQMVYFDFNYGEARQQTNIYNWNANAQLKLDYNDYNIYRNIAPTTDTVAIYRTEYSDEFLFEKGDFLGMTYDRDGYNAALFADTAYVRNNTEKPLFMLAVRPEITPAKTYCPDHGFNTDCPAQHLDTIPGYVDADYLTSLADSAAAYAKLLDNPYLDNGKYTKLAFVGARHNVDTVTVASTGKEFTITEGLVNPMLFAFRIVNQETQDFVIETADLKDNKKVYDANTNPYVISYVRWNNGVPVLTKDITDAEVFNVKTDLKDANPTANEEIATSSVVVAGTNGAVVVKGAEGKSVIVSTILGKVVANEVLTSDNATIAAPQGVVVVSVDGESFKVVVK